MPTSIRPICERPPRGFTLVELMIVLVLIGLAASAIVLTLPSPAATVRDDAERFAARLGAARDAAVIGARAMQVSVSPSGYAFARRQGATWEPLDEKPFVTTDWRRGASALVGSLGRQRIVFEQCKTVRQQCRDMKGLIMPPLAADGRRALLHITPCAFSNGEHGVRR